MYNSKAKISTGVDQSMGRSTPFLLTAKSYKFSLFWDYISQFPPILTPPCLDPSLCKSWIQPWSKHKKEMPTISQNCRRDGNYFSLLPNWQCRRSRLRRVESVWASDWTTHSITSSFFWYGTTWKLLLFTHRVEVVTRAWQIIPSSL